MLVMSGSRPDLAATILVVLWTVVILVLTSCHPIEETSETKSPYAEVPCDMRPLSGWRDDWGNLWGIGARDLWWYNYTAHAWNVSPLPASNSSDTSSWRVTCGQSGSHLVVMGRRETYLFRIPTLEWKRVGRRYPGPSGNRTAVWCHNDSLLLMDLAQSALYSLNPDKGKWYKKAKTPEILQMLSFITHETFKHTVTWYGTNQLLYLFLETPTNTSRGSLGSLWTTSLSNVTWYQVAGQSEDGEAWPDLHTEAVTWASEDSLWLWKLGVDMEEVWQFDLASKSWTQVLLKQTGMEDHLDGPSLTKRLAAWTQGDQLCVLVTRGTCAREYVPGTTWCLHTVVTVRNGVANETTPEIESTPETLLLPAAALLQAINGSQQVMVLDIGNQSSPLIMNRDEDDNSVDRYNPHSFKAYWHPHKSGSEAGLREGVDFNGPVASLASWSHQHSSVFGSIVFFGTSLTIFAMVGIVWCVKKCVHFPKEALLLRDPPSVRYTAIPDTLA